MAYGQPIQQYSNTQSPRARMPNGRPPGGQQRPQARFAYQSPQGGNPMGQGQGQAPGANSGMSIGTSINPAEIYPEDFTRQAGNLAAALATPGRADLMSPAGMQGVSSYSPMTQWGIGAGYADMLAQAMMAPQEISQAHGFANAQNVLQGQQARGQEALGWGQLGLQNQNNLLGLLAHIM